MRRLYSGKSIHQCIQLIYLLLLHTGYLGFKLEDGTKLYYTQWSCAYAYMIRFLMLLSFFGGVTLKFLDEESYNAMIGPLTPVLKFVLFLECSLTTLTYIEVSLLLDKTRKKHLDYVLRLQRLDDELIRDFPFVNWNYQKSARKYNPLTVYIYGFFLIISFSYVFSISNCKCGWFSSFIIAYSYACVTGSPGLTTFLFVAGMDMVRLRYRLLRKLIKIYFVEQGGDQTSDLQKLKKFQLLKHYFKEYTYLIPAINNVLGSSTATSMFYYVAVVTNMGFLICSKAIEAKSKWVEYFVIVLFMIPRIYNLIIVNIYGFLAEREKRSCCQEFVRMEIYFSKPLLIREELQSFLHWRMHNTYYFAIGKVLRCNFVMIILIVNSIVNYIIILIQLQLQQNTITDNLNRGRGEDVELVKP